MNKPHNRPILPQFLQQGQPQSHFEALASGGGYPEQLDLVMEVVSDGEEARRRDYEEKRRDYARAGISEYWIVDPELRCITVLGLNQAQTFDVLGLFHQGEVASGRYFDRFSVDVTTLLLLEGP